MNDDVALTTTLRRLVAEVCALDEASIRDDVPLLEYGLDSARAIDLLVSLEGELDLRIPDDDVATMRTLADLEAYLRDRIAKK